jgi:hypothetical protein
MKSKLVISFMTMAALPAVAQPVESPSNAAPALEAPVTQLELAVDIAAAGELDHDAIRLALASELGVSIVDRDAFAPSVGRLAIDVAGGVLRLTYQPAQGERVERSVALPSAASDRVQLIGFLATNLVRDQVSALLATMPPPPVARPVVVVPPPVVEPKVEKRASRGTSIPATIGFIPPLAVDRIAGSEVTVGLGVHLIAGMTDSSTIASVSGIVDIQRNTASGLQIGGIGTIAGRHVHGIQVGGIATYSPNVDGGQVGGVATVARRLHGVQVAGVAAVAQRVDGMQVAGVANVAERVDGVQIGGVANVAGNVDGAQIGVINVAKRMRGLQLGVLNISDDGDGAYPIGLLNFARNGRVEVDGWVESSKLSAIALRHGPKHIHNIVALGWTPDHDHVLAGLGLGFHRNLSSGPRPLTLDVDAMNWWTNVWEGELGQLNQLRVTVAVPVGAVDVFAGAAANVYISDEMDESEHFNPQFTAKRVMTDGGTQVVSWPSVFAGVRMHAR